MAGIDLGELNAWLEAQLEQWAAWTESAGSFAWLQLPTGNPRFPSCGELFRHAFTPLRRYSAQTLGQAPPDDSHVPATDWAALAAWARDCLAEHRNAVDSLAPEQAVETFVFQTRSAGELRVEVRMALAHAATHCFWHLGGIAQLLRAAGHAPPQRSDLIFWAVQQRRSESL